MHDMLVKLYDLDNDWSFVGEQEKKGIVIKKPIGSEIHLVIDWVKEKFSPYWESEVKVATSKHPFSCFIAVDGCKIVGFSCYNSTAIGFFGPTGVDEDCRGKGTGTALLKAALLDMKMLGFGYAIIGGVGPAEYYKKVVNAVDIPDSSPGVYRNLLRSKK